MSFRFWPADRRAAEARRDAAPSDAAVRPSLAELVALRDRATDGAWDCRPSRAVLSGGHRAAQSGRGMEFFEARPYQPGDDVRRIDWRHTAQRGRPYTKLFESERERPVLLVVDVGASMRFGTRVAFKSVVAARAAALLAWAAVKAGDRIGGIVTGPDTVEMFHPRLREQGVLPLLARIASAGAAPAEAVSAAAPAQGIGAALRTAMLSAGRECLIIAISDFHALDDVACDALTGLGRRANLALVRVYDAFEAQPPPPGDYLVADTQRVRSLALHSPQARVDYACRFRARGARLASLARGLRAPLLSLATHEDPATVMHALAARGSCAPAASLPAYG